jgi:hypothetical protein
MINGAALYLALGGGIGSDFGCQVDGIDSSCSSARRLLDDGAAAQCPHNACSGFTDSGEFVRFYAFAGGTDGYFRPADIGQGVYDVDGKFYGESGYQGYVKQKYADQIESQRAALLNEIATREGIQVHCSDGVTTCADKLIVATEDGYVQGGNFNFPTTLPSDYCPSGRCDDGIHVHDGYVHLDSANPHDVPWGSLVHFGIDIIVGNLFTLVIPR